MRDSSNTGSNGSNVEKVGGQVVGWAVVASLFFHSLSLSLVWYVVVCRSVVEVVSGVWSMVPTMDGCRHFGLGAWRL
jgi:hypothetical protein